MVHDRGTAIDAPTPASTTRYNRIITLSPTITEYVYTLGRGDDIIAVGDFCNFPADTRNKIKIGHLITPNFEKILTLKPDCIIIQGKNRKLGQFCRRHRIRFIRLRFDDLNAIYESISLLGDALSGPDAAANLVKNMRSALDDVRSAAAQRRRVKTFICVNRSKSGIHDISTINSNGFLGQLVSIAGGENICSDLGRDYSLVSREFIIREMPEIIIEFRPGEQLGDSNLGELIEDWQSLATTPAVTNQRIYIFTDDFFLVPGPRVPLVAERLFGLIHEMAPSSATMD